MSEQQQEQPQEQMIANEAVFLQSLGVNPGTVKVGTVNVEFVQGQPVITFTSVYPVSPRALGLAFLAAGAEEQPVEEEKKPRQRRQPADRKTPAKKAAPRKAQQ